MMQGPFIYCLTEGAVDEMKDKMIMSGAYANVLARVSDDPSVLQYATLEPAAARAAAPTTTGPAPGPAASGPALRQAPIVTLASDSAGSQQQAAPQPTTSTQARDARATRRAIAAAGVAAPSTLSAATTLGAGNSPTSSTSQVPDRYLPNLTCCKDCCPYFQTTYHQRMSKQCPKVFLQLCCIWRMCTHLKHACHTHDVSRR
jgi:hypothetical protein